MKNAWMKMMVVTGMMLTASHVLAAEASVSVDFASAYVFRGVTFNDGAVAQPGMEVEGLPVSLGLWGNLDIADYDGNVADGQFSELDLFGSYTLPIEALELSIGYTEYLYPSAGGDADREVSLSAGFDLPLSPSVAVYYGIGGAIEESLYVEAGVEQEIAVTDELAVTLGSTLGYASPDGGEEGFSHWTASIGASFSMFSAGVTYVGQIDDEVLPDYEAATAEADASLGYDAEVIATVGFGMDF